ncbi:unnamed protein product [Pleuronectes platessa]|uniref:Uncharacterized protein n=1 Tax=Pleuronectes platessa TaxID=8262 RepID=A0A9N7YXC0_PLEPL|nr:unnamed protein product [Pleuronectes platessa]
MTSVRRAAIKDQGVYMWTLLKMPAIFGRWEFPNTDLRAVRCYVDCSIRLVSPPTPPMIPLNDVSIRRRKQAPDGPLLQGALPEESSNTPASLPLAGVGIHLCQKILSPQRLDFDSLSQPVDGEHGAIRPCPPSLVETKTES